MLLQQCNSSGILVDTAEVTAKDGYYCGMTLIGDGQAASRVDITDGNGKTLALVQVLAGEIGYAHDCPSLPIVALQGVHATYAGSGGEFVVRYAETISGLKREV